MVAVLGEASARAALRRHGRVAVRLRSGQSPAGAEVEIIPAPRIVEGMAAVVSTPQGLVLRRILRVAPPWAIHAGDGPTPASRCRLSDVVGMPAIEAVEIGGGSMAPTLPAGRVVVVQPRVPRVGEVALFGNRRGPLVHRILDRAGEWVIHGGDASPVPGIASRREILGTVPAPRPLSLPAVRYAHVLGLVLRAAVPFAVLGCLPPRSIRAPFRILKKLLRRLHRRA